MSEPESHREHQDQASRWTRDQPVRCGVLTVSDSRTEATDRGGPLVQDLLTKAGHAIVADAIVPDEPEKVRAAINQWCRDSAIQAIITTGGTGVSRRDVTVEVVRSLIDYEIPGFGELFRMLSYEQVKAAAMLSRAIAGLSLHGESEGGETYIFALPGSPNAIETAMNGLIVPQLAHLVWERRK